MERSKNARDETEQRREGGGKMEIVKQPW